MELIERQFEKIQRICNVCETKYEYHTTSRTNIEKQLPVLWVFSKKWAYHNKKCWYYLKQWEKAINDWDFIIDYLKKQIDKSEKVF